MGVVPLVLCIDVEPDARVIDPNGATPWHGSDDVFAWLAALRPTLQERTGWPVHFNWFIRLDPQIERAYGRVWPIEQYRAHFEACHALGDTIGIHPHVWRWDTRRETWFTDNADQSWIDHCVRSAVTSFSEGFQRRPEACRLGDRDMTNATMALLESLGIRFDLTIEAGMPRLPAAMLPDFHTADLPDYRRVPSAPYRPSSHEYRRPAWRHPRDLWVVPLSTGTVRHPGRWCRSRQTLNLASDFLPLLIDQVLAQKRLLLVISGRTGDVATAQRRAAFQRNLEYYATHPRARDFAFSTVQEAVASSADRVPFAPQ